MRVVLDSNVFISALIVTEGHPRQALDAAFERAYDLVISNHILEEVERNLRLPRIMKRVPSSAAGDPVDAYLSHIRALAALVEPSSSMTGIVRDPTDDPVLGTAVSGEATCLVTGDQDLLALAMYEGIVIVTPRQFIAILDSLEER